MQRTSKQLKGKTVKKNIYITCNYLTSSKKLKCLCTVLAYIHHHLIRYLF